MSENEVTDSDASRAASSTASQRTERPFERPLAQAVETLRLKLLDLTLKNPLLNFRLNAKRLTAIRVVDELPDELYERLTDDSSTRRLSFDALPPLPAGDETGVDDDDATANDGVDDAPGAAGDRRWTPAAWAQANGINPNFELPKRATHERHNDENIQTLLWPKQLEAISQKLRDQQRTAEQELGFGTLHATFGYLEWREADASERPLFAPLLLVPVRTDRQLAGGHYYYYVEADGQAPLTNICLREKMRRLFGLEIPELEDEDTAETYWARVEQLIDGRVGWRVVRSVTFSHLAFARLAMYSDLDATRWNEPPHEQPLVSKLLAGIPSGGDESPDPQAALHAEVYEVDSPATAAKVPYVITDLDSSQFSAVVDAVDGKDFALQGPPGTGKSQTITAMIAAALAQGKSVLFVAEKMAALEVVSKRLGDAGLAPFLLELHSTKTNKRRLLDSFDARLKLKASRSDRTERSLVSTLARLEAERAALKHYVDALNTAVGASGLTLHDVFWHEQAARRGLDGTSVDVTTLPIEVGVEQATPAARERWAQAFARHAGLAARVRETEIDGRHPLAAIKKPGSSSFDVPALDAALNALAHALGEFERTLSQIDQHCMEALPRDASALLPLSQALLSLPVPAPEASSSVIKGLLRGATLAQLGGAVTCLERIAAARQPLTDAWLDPEKPIADPSIGERARVHFVRTAELGFTAGPAELTARSLAEEHEQLVKIASALEIVMRVAAHWGIPEPTTLDEIAALTEAIALVRSTQPAALVHRHAGSFLREAREELVRLEARRAALASTLQAHRETYEIGSDATAAEFAKHAEALEVMGLFTYWLSREGKRVRAFNKRLARGQKMPREALAAASREIAHTLDSLESFTTELTQTHVVGPHARGLETPFPALIAAATYVATVYEKFPVLIPQRAPFTSVLHEKDAKVLEVAHQVPGEALEVLGQLGRSLTWSRGGAFPERLKARRTAIDAAIAEHLELSALGAVAAVSVQAWAESAAHAADVAAARAALAPLAGWLALPTPVPLRAEEHLVRLKASKRYYDQVSASAVLPKTKARLLSLDDLPSGPPHFHKVGALLVRAIKAWNDALRGAEAAIGFSPETPAGGSLQVLARELSTALSLGADEKSDWMAYLSDVESIDGAGYRSLRLALQPLGLSGAHAEAAFRAAHLRSLIAHASKTLGGDVLRRGQSLTDARTALASLDREYVRLSRERLAETLCERPVPAGSSHGPVKGYTDLGLIRHEIAKQRANISIRQLMSRAAGAARALKPCFMMSPASVSHFLPSIPQFFDLLVIDESSQMRPEEALVALARAKQAVIVGDPKQLPPTAFFMGGADTTDDSAGDADDDDKLATHDESILDRALGALRPSRDLQWHYRSRHQSLIAFSNREFYRDRLTVFPSPVDSSAELGVAQVYVAEGVYQGRKNAVEAAKVLETVRDLVRANADRSIGVVAVNREQTDLLNQEWDRMCADDPLMETYRLRWANTLDEFFIKNLENVQGDERDVIVISTVYGPEALGAPVKQRFGPINTSQGARRLNVLFTRAKERVVLVTSLRSEDVQADERAAQGRQVFKRYLEYARSGRLDQGAPQGDFESPFEEEVANVLVARGFEVASQVGVAGYRIDLAVRSPRNRDYFLLGIECDGATYHSAKCARDRDRLREDVLKRLGWDLYRIWSTDWFHSRPREIERLVGYVRERAERG